MCKTIGTTLFLAIAATGRIVLGADDLTVAYGDTFNVSADASYANLVVNGTLNVAEGVRLTCDRFTLGENLDHTLDMVARMTVASNATVKVNNTDGNCKIGVNSRAVLTLEGGSTFESARDMILGSGCTGTTEKVVFVTVNVNDATLTVGGPLQFSGCWESDDAIESAVVSLNGPNAIAIPRYATIKSDKEGCDHANARIRFNGGKLKASGWYDYGRQAVVTCPYGAQKFWLESVDGNPIWIVSEGWQNTKGFFDHRNPWPWPGASRHYFLGTGPLVLENTDSESVDFCYHTGDSLSSGYEINHTGGVRIYGKVAINNDESYAFAAGALSNAKLELPLNAELDVGGRNLIVGSLESVGKIVNSGESESTLTVGGNDGAVILSTPTLGAGVKLVKTGDGTLYAPSGALGDVEIQSGAFDFGNRKSVGFPFYRFWVYGKSHGGGDDGGHCTVVELSEFELYDNDSSIRDRVTHVSYFNYSNYDKTPANLFNSDTGLSWASRWYSDPNAEASNSVFFAAHFGDVGKFSYVSRTESGWSANPKYERIGGAPLFGALNEKVTSYRYRLGETGWYGYTNPEYFRFQGGLGDDEWVDLENWKTRGRYEGLGHGDSFKWSEEFALAYPTNVVSVETLDVNAGVEWTLDVAQTDLTAGTINIAGSGTLRLENFGKVRSGKALPVKFTTITGADNLKNWDVYVDGVKTNRRICAVDGRLLFERNGSAIVIR